ncbi:MAG TPA: DUF5946 family protein [Acidisarcina sp.]
MICPGCQASFEDTEGPIHPYMLSAPACWATYGRILATEYTDYRLMRQHRLTVDTYAVQHPGINTRAARRSVGVHLSRLYLLLERGWPIERANEAALAINRFKDQCEWLVPPSMLGTLSVIDVAGAPARDSASLNDAAIEDHEARVKDWAASVWSA